MDSCLRKNRKQNQFQSRKVKKAQNFMLAAENILMQLWLIWFENIVLYRLIGVEHF